LQKLDLSWDIQNKAYFLEPLNGGRESHQVLTGLELRSDNKMYQIRPVSIKTRSFLGISVTSKSFGY